MPRTAMKTDLALLQQAPYAGMFTPIDPIAEVPVAGAAEFESCRTQPRSAEETKGEGYDATADGASSCC